MSKFWANNDDNSSNDNDEMMEIDETFPSQDPPKQPENDKNSKQSDEDVMMRLSLDPDAAWKHIFHKQVFLESPTHTQRHNKRDYLRIVCMSDTHGKHREVFVPSHADILIHGGDMTKSGEPGAIEDLSRYFGEILETTDIRRVICIAGNHDTTLDETYYARSWSRFHRRVLDCGKSKTAVESHSTYLLDSSCHVKRQDNDDDSIEVYGSPWTPEFFDWAFNLPRGMPCDKAWSKIPESADVLVTHGPPLGRGDDTVHGVRSGCYHLLKHIQERVKPRLHIFGHIHESTGTSFDGQTLYINASSVTINYQAHHNCIVVDLPWDKSKPAVVVQPQCKIHTGREFLSWLETHKYFALAAYFKKEHDDNWMAQDLKLLGESCFMDICDRFYLHRDDKARKELRRALSHLYADSF